MIAAGSPALDLVVVERRRYGGAADRRVEQRGMGARCEFAGVETGDVIGRDGAAQHLRRERAPRPVG